MKMIFCNGCFDVLHRGHIELLKYARSLGEKLVVGIDSDDRVKYLKGSARPFNSQDDRKAMLESIKYVDEVFIFGSEGELELLIKDLKPSTMIVGEEYKNKKVVGYTPDIELRFFNKINGYSTTDFIKNITSR